MSSRFCSKRTGCFAVNVAILAYKQLRISGVGSNNCFFPLGSVCFDPRQKSTRTSDDWRCDIIFLSYLNISRQKHNQKSPSDPTLIVRQHINTTNKFGRILRSDLELDNIQYGQSQYIRAHLKMKCKNTLLVTKFQQEEI